MLSVTLIEVPTWGTMNLVEFLWLLAGAGAMFFPAIHLRPLYRDWLAAQIANLPIIQLVAAGYLRREIIRLLQGVCITAIGVYASVSDSPIGDMVTVTALVITGVFLSLAALVTVQSIWDWKTRGQVQHLIDASE